MKRTITILSLLASIASSVFGQQIQEVSTSAGYQKQSYFRLADGTEKQSANTAWDIAFTVFGQQDAGIHVNEAAGSSMGQPLPAVRVFDALTGDFSATFDPAALESFELLNAENSWAHGAFNENRDPADPFDFGWGQYDPAAQQVTGSSVYVVKLRDGSHRKFKVESLTAAGYTFKYANLDGSGEATKTISKADFAGKTLAYFSFSTQNVVDVEPSGKPFDLLYTRYSTPLFDPGSGAYIPYSVTGILSGRGVEVAKADGIDPATVQFSAWKDSLKADLSAIGYDWKSLAGTAWAIDADRVYFVKTADQHLWKVQFIDFEGSSTGKTVFEKTDLGTVSAVGGPGSPLASLDVFPNPAPAGGETSLVFSAKKPGAALVTLTDAAGRTVQSRQLPVGTGPNAPTLPLGGLPGGAYRLSVLFDGQVFGKTIIVQQ